MLLFSFQSSFNVLQRLKSTFERRLIGWLTCRSRVPSPRKQQTTRLGGLQMSERVRLLKEEAHLLNSQLSKPKKAPDAAVSSSDGQMIEVRALELRERMLCDELDSPKRLESTNCDLEVNTRK